MNIVVCVKQVMDTEALIELDDSGEVITEGRTQIIDPYGEFAVEKAVQLKEQLGGEVTCLCYGDDGCTSAIRHALAMGADKARRSLPAPSRVCLPTSSWADGRRAIRQVLKLWAAFPLFSIFPLRIWLPAWRQPLMA